MSIWRVFLEFEIRCKLTSPQTCLSLWGTVSSPPAYHSSSQATPLRSHPYYTHIYKKYNLLSKYFKFLIALGTPIPKCLLFLTGQVHLLLILFDGHRHCMRLLQRYDSLGPDAFIYLLVANLLRICRGLFRLLPRYWWQMNSTFRWGLLLL